MTVEPWLWASIAIPLAIAAVLWLAPIARERAIAHLALAGAGLSAAASLVALAAWLVAGAHPIHTAPRLVLGHASYRFTGTLVLDGAAAVFLALVQFITGTVVRFSRFYLHREPGFRRFFATVLLFQAGMCLLVLAGNLDLMFAGWELVGVSSFLLIAFYRERQSAVRNALKTYSIYRIADAGMLLAACLEGAGVHAGAAIGLLLLVAAMGKSAQFPFSFWVARAMEGPTPSSALFYGALSVHAGAYLLVRTFGLWGGVLAVRVCIAVIGLATAVTCSMFGAVQPTIKGQIGYASVSQVGVIFVELAFGFVHLALLHVVCNALVRCYQLLVSPSVVAHRLRRQATAGAAHAEPRRSITARLVPRAWWPTLYAFALSEGYTKEVLKAALWFPLRRLGEQLKRGPRVLAAAAAAAGAAALVLAHAHGRADHVGAAAIVLAVAVACSAAGLASWRTPCRAIVWIAASMLAASAAALAAPGAPARFPVACYAASIVLSCGLAVAGLAGARTGGAIATRFAGLWMSRPRRSVLALAGALGLAGVPLLPTFFGEDMLVDAALGDSRGLALAIAGVIALDGYLAVRTFAYAFFGAGAPKRSAWV